MTNKTIIFDGVSYRTILFNDVSYLVPEWVKWVAQHEDGTIQGYQYEPFADHTDGLYWIDHGQKTVLHSPLCKMKLEYVGGQ